MSSARYLWMNMDSRENREIYVYLNEFGKKIYGTTVSNCMIISPYIYSDVPIQAKCVGKAVKYVDKYNNLFEPPYE